MKLTQILVISLLLLTVSCSMAPKKKPPVKTSAVQKKQFNKAKSLLKQKSTQKALNELEQFAQQHPSSDLSDDALMLAGNTAFQEKNYNRAYKAYISIVRSQFYSPVESEAAIGAAHSLKNLSRFDEALSLVKRVQNSKNAPTTLLFKNEKLKYSLLNQLGDGVESLASLLRLSTMEPNEAHLKSYKLKMIDIIETQLSKSELDFVARKSSSPIASAYSYSKLASIYFEEKNFSEAKSVFEKVIELLPHSELSEKAQLHIQQIQARETVEPKNIGIVLPLSGRHAAIAQRTLRGLQLGLGIYGPNPSNFNLAVVDSEANPDTSRRAVKKLVLEDHVIAIVGSLLSKTASAVAAKSEELGVPNITLSQKSGLTDIGPYVFRNALTSEMQVRSLVKTAMGGRNIKKFAILYPNDNYGVEYANIFWDEVLAHGGEITGAQPYNPNETDFSDPIKRLAGTFYISDRESEYRDLLKKWYKSQKFINSRTTPPSDLLPAAKDFDAIFIPDSIKSIGQIAPMLAYNEVNNKVLLGTNIWNSPELVRRGQQYVENSMFVDGMMFKNSSYSRSQFYQDYHKTFNQTPSIFEAQAYDVGLLLRQLISDGNRSRLDLRVALSQVNNFDGSIGKLKMNAKREIDRPIFDLIVRKGQVVELTEKILEEVNTEVKKP